MGRLSGVLKKTFSESDAYRLDILNTKAAHGGTMERLPCTMGLEFKHAA